MMSRYYVYSISLVLGLAVTGGLGMTATDGDPASGLREHLQDEPIEIVALIDPSDCDLTGRTLDAIRSNLRQLTGRVEVRGVFLRVPDVAAERRALIDAFSFPFTMTFDEDGYWLDLYKSMAMHDGVLVVWQQNRLKAVLPLTWAADAFGEVFEEALSLGELARRDVE